RWLLGCRLRECWFEPTFHKHQGKLCAGVQIHVEGPAYRHEQFRPWRLMAAAFKALRALSPDYALWRDFPYEYEKRLAIDVINGGEGLREWVDDRSAGPADLEALARPDETAWLAEREPLLLYRCRAARSARASCSCSTLQVGSTMSTAFRNTGRRSGRRGAA